MSQANHQLVYGYWAIRGLAEPSRLTLHYSKTPFTDKFYVQGEGPEFSRQDWLKEKFDLGLDFPNLPYLIDGDLKLTQSKAILYYLGRKFNLMGKTPAEEAQVMMLCEEAHDLRISCSGVFYSPKGESAEERKQFGQTFVSDKLNNFEKYFAKTSSKFAVGDQVTVADFQLFDYIDAALAFDEENTLLEKFPHVKRFLTTIRELPELKDYIVKSQAELPLNNKVAKYGGKVLQRK